MKLFSRETLQRLVELDIVVDMREHADDLRKFAENNIRQEKRKPLHERRSDDVIINHSATGLAAEKAVETIGFIPNSPIVEDAMKLSFVSRMTDHVVDGVKVAVKSTNPAHKHMTISHNQMESVLRSCKLNDVFLVMGCESLGSLKFHVTPHFLVDAAAFPRYIRLSQYKKNSYYFAHREAIEHDHCIDLKEKAHV